MDDEEWEAGLWTDGTRADFVRTAESAIAALQAYVAMVAAASSAADEPMIDRAERAVRSRLVAMSDAELSFSSTSGPCGSLMLDDEDDGVDGDDDVQEDGDAVDLDAEDGRVSVLVRHDFRVTSEAAVLAAGRAASWDIWPEAADDVGHLGRAVHRLMRRTGLESLAHVPGLQPTAGIALVVGHDQPLTQADLTDGMDDPAALFDLDGVLLHAEADVRS
ncbi:hypothetical protein JL107_14735 [Nakamurella flavida]|uniref:Uncharacterized protein n=1 Tax=Nakamurella flavida TaxID=363630 RepID=A0A939C3I9_9ACTN|nr:hypothetical protein [Nakamurella flavida]MBM9477705.1 hypothetical protein [Nakamurella flavida]MDP9779257.1 hypothetical protein [Nakamurella flavida]